MKRRNKKILALILVLLVAVAAVSVGIFRMEQSRAKGTGASQQAEEGAGRDADSPQQAAGGTDPEAASGDPLATLFFASDYQAEEGFDAPAETLRGILAAANADGKDIEMAVMCGDYTNDDRLHDYQLSPDGSIAEIREVIGSECSGLNAEDILIVQGNHDQLTGEISESGLHEYEDYLIYVLNTEEDFPWKQGKTAGCLAKVRKSSAAMKECFDELIRKGESRPVFIAGHVPLHFTARTSSRHTTGDNLYSSLIFDVVNDAAKSLDIIYLFGHDHSKGWDCYLGGSSVYLAKGDTILIPRFNEQDINTDEYSRETLNFTYLNAGYTGYYMNCGPEERDAGEVGMYSAADETLTGTVFEIYRNKVTVTRYDGGGAHVLGHQGEADPYKGGIDEGLISADDYSHETASPQTISLNTH